jgi:hypothetical protein
VPWYDAAGMFGKTGAEYIRFERWILILIVLVFAVRLGMSLAGVPNDATKWVSINLVLLVGLVYCGVVVHTARFGSYKHLYPLLLFQNGVAHWLIGMAIILGIVTGHNNIFTAPEYFGGQDGKNWIHALIHIVLGPPILSLFAWLFASAILFITRKIRP